MMAKEHHNMNAHEKAAHDLLMAAVKEDGQPRDMDAAYREMLDDSYSFEKVGGPFACMLASDILEHVDPTAFSCGFSDYLDSEQVTEIGDEYFDSKELEDIREQVADALDSEITDLESAIEESENEIAELEDENPQDVSEEEVRDRALAACNEEISAATKDLEEKQAILAAVKAYTF